MKFKPALYAVMACAAFSGAVHAQSSVTLYGIISTGVAYASNEDGSHNIKMLTGTMQNNRLGFRISEDLGNGLHVIGVLENGFDITNGTAMQGARMFGRQAYVGLSSNWLGTLTSGRQYDMMWDYLDRYEAAVSANGLATHVGDNDNAFATFRYNNSVKYATPNWHGFTAEALYAFSNSPGNFSANDAFSVGMGYTQGHLSIGAAYVELHHPGTTINSGGAVTNDYGGAPFMPFEHSRTGSDVDTQRIFGAGASYDFGPTQLNAMITDVRYHYLDQSSLHLDNYDISTTYYFTPSLIFGAAYVYTRGNSGGGGTTSVNPEWHMAQLSLDYLLSKRTDVYVYTDAQHASGGTKADIWLFDPSSTGAQVIAVAGIRHKF